MTNDDDDGLLCKLCDPILIIVKDFSQDINTHILSTKRVILRI